MTGVTRRPGTFQDLSQRMLAAAFPEKGTAEIAEQARQITDQVRSARRPPAVPIGGTQIRPAPTSAPQAHVHGRLLFRADGLVITDEWVQSRSGTFRIRDIRSAWITRRQAPSANLWKAVLSAGAVAIVTISAFSIGWLGRNWVWLLLTPMAFILVGLTGVLEPLLLARRPHELWITTDSAATRLWQHNMVEVSKALRAIKRSQERERHQA